MTRKALFALALLGALLDPPSLAQRGPSRESDAYGLKWVLESCQLQNRNLTCTVKVTNPGQRLLELLIPPDGVMAITSLGRLYPGQALPNFLRVNPGQTTQISLGFSGIPESTDFFPAIRVGEAFFLGVSVPIPSEKVSVSRVECGIGNLGVAMKIKCSLTLMNHDEKDFNLLFFPGQSFTTLDTGMTHYGAGSREAGYSDRASVLIPARGEASITVFFDANMEGFKASGYFPKRAKVLRIKVQDGWIDLRDVPFRYCADPLRDYGRAVCPDGT